jgi:general stress protein 26
MKGKKMSQHDETRQQILRTIETINMAFKRGTGFERLGPLVHEDVVTVLPGFAARVQGRDLCLKSYEDTCSQMTFHKLDVSDEHVDVYGPTAVVSYKYNCTWEYRDKRFDDDGHEIMVFVQDGDDWRMAWRTLIPGSRQVETCPTQESQAPTQSGIDVRQVCLNLMNSVPACELTTMDPEGFPHTTAMLNLRSAKEYPALVKLHEESGNAFGVYMTTSMESNKMARMQANPKVSVFFRDQAGTIGFMLGGEIEIIADQDLKNRVWQKGWTMYYPNGPQGSEYGVIRLEPRVVKGWCRNQTFELQITG